MTGKNYRVGSYVIEPARYRVTRADVPIPLEPKVFDLLVHLVRNRDRVLTREELFEAIWEGRPVSDATLSNHVKSARRALGDSGELQETIQTIRGRGYRFAAPVEEFGVDGGVHADHPAPPATAVGTPARTARGWRVPAALAAVALLALAALVGQRASNDPVARPPAERPYVLVMPFGVSANATDHHQMFADQLTREVIASLRKISGLRTVPQATAFQFRRDKSSERAIASVPGIRFILSGEVSVAPDGTLRISPRLTDVHDDLDVWDSAFRVRADQRDFFEAPAAIASAVAAALRVEIVKNEQRALAQLPSVPEAYAPYAAGWREMDLFTHASLRRAVAHFDAAIARDPDFLAARRGRSDALRIIFTYFEAPQDLLPVVEGSLQAVLARDPDDAEALSSLGLTQVMAWKWRDAWSNLSRARSLDRSLAQTELGFALYFAALGETAKVKQAVTRASELDPLNTELADWGTWALFMAGELDAARAWARKQMRDHPDNGFVFCGAGVAAYLSGDVAAGVTLLEKGADLTDRAPVALIMLAQAYGYAGRPEKVRPLLAEAEAARVYMCPYETAAAYLTLGDADSKTRAMVLLEEAAAKRSNCLIFLRVDPRLGVLRTDPRFADRLGRLLTRVGLDDAAVSTYRK